MYRLKSPLAAQVELTLLCNNLCYHCYNYWRSKEHPDPASRTCENEEAASLRRVVDLLIEEEVMSITLTGGEPFLRRELLFELLAKLKAARRKVSINTNGTLVTADDSRRLREGGIDLVVVSLSGHDSETNDLVTNRKSYEGTVEAIRRLSAEGISVLVNMVVSRMNLTDVLKTAKLVKSIGVDAFAATPVLACTAICGNCDDILLSTDEIKVVLDELLAAKDMDMRVDVLEPLAHCMFTAKERLRYRDFLGNRTCFAGISDLVIAPNGDVRSCIMSDEVVGNIHVDGWHECWRRLEGWCGSDMLPPSCIQCSVVDYCGGGCRVAALATHGQINARDPYMTSPILNMESVAEVGDVFVNVPAITDSTPLEFCADFVARKESFGGIVGSQGKALFLEKDGYIFMERLLRRQTFSIDDMLGSQDLDKEDVRQFLTLLMAQGFVTIAADKKGGDASAEEAIVGEVGYSA